MHLRVGRRLGSDAASVAPSCLGGRISRGFHRLSRRGFGAIALLLGLVLWAMPAAAQCVSNVCTVANATDLVSALTTIDTTPGTYTINITGNITLTAGTTLPAITGSANNVTINGGPGITLNGGNVQRGFFVYQGTVTINNLTIENTVAQGGTGGVGGVGGGGGGLGVCVRGLRRQPVGQQRQP